MAKALECPACGAKHRLDGLEASTTFRCEQCGQTLRSRRRSRTSARRSGGAPTTVDHDVEHELERLHRRDVDVPPPPRRGHRRRCVPVRESSAGARPRRLTARRPYQRRQRPTREARRDDHAKPTGTPPTPRPLVLAHRRVGGVGSARLRGHRMAGVRFRPDQEGRRPRRLRRLGHGHYTRLAIGTLMWALVTALLVQLFIEGGRVWADRRRRARDSAKTVPALG